MFECSPCPGKNNSKPKAIAPSQQQSICRIYLYDFTKAMHDVQHINVFVNLSLHTKLNARSTVGPYPTQNDTKRHKANSSQYVFLWFYPNNLQQHVCGLFSLSPHSIIITTPCNLKVLLSLSKNAITPQNDKANNTQYVFMLLPKQCPETFLWICQFVSHFSRPCNLWVIFSVLKSNTATRYENKANSRQCVFLWC